jgi:hypothetical protein
VPQVRPVRRAQVEVLETERAVVVAPAVATTAARRLVAISETGLTLTA